MVSTQTLASPRRGESLVGTPHAGGGTGTSFAVRAPQDSRNCCMETQKVLQTRASKPASCALLMGSLSSCISEMSNFCRYLYCISQEPSPTVSSCSSRRRVWDHKLRECTGKVQGIYGLGTGNACAGEAGEVPNRISKTPGGLLLIQFLFQHLLAALLALLAHFKPGYRQMAHGVRLSWSVPALWQHLEILQISSIAPDPAVLHGCLLGWWHPALPASQLLAVSPHQWSLLGKPTACAEALSCGHTAGTLQGCLWEKDYFRLARARSQQKHMSKRNYCLSSWVLFHVLWIYFFLFPPPKLNLY